MVKIGDATPNCDENVLLVTSSVKDRIHKYFKWDNNIKAIVLVWLSNKLFLWEISWKLIDVKSILLLTFWDNNGCFANAARSEVGDGNRIMMLESSDDQCNSLRCYILVNHTTLTWIMKYLLRAAFVGDEIGSSIIAERSSSWKLLAVESSSILSTD